MNESLYHLIVFCVSVAACIGLIVVDPKNAGIYSGLVSALIGGGAVVTGSKLTNKKGSDNVG